MARGRRDMERQELRELVEDALEVGTRDHGKRSGDAEVGSTHGTGKNEVRGHGSSS
jgi:hypothetical protein